MLRYKSLLILYFISFLVIPNYSGIQLPGLPLLSVQRVVLICLLGWMVLKKTILNCFIRANNHIAKSEFAMMMLLLAAALVTGLLNGMNSFFNPLFDWAMAFFMFRFMFSHYLDMDETIDLLKKIFWVIGILGLVEALTGVNVFTFLDTGMTSGLNNGALMRGADLRICSAYGHPLAYSLVINLFFPILCYNTHTKRINLLQNGGLVALLFLNVLLSGSRSGIAVFVVEFILILVCTSKIYYSRLLFYTIATIVIIGLVLIYAGRTEPVQQLIRAILYVVDEIFGTNYAVLWGGDQGISNSSLYRTVLWKILSIKQYRSWFGMGNDMRISLSIDGFYVESIDNYYICTYLRSGIIGLFSSCGFLLSHVFNYIRTCFHNKNRSLALLGLISLCGYVGSLFVVDEIGTFRISMLVFAFFSVHCLSKGNHYE